MPQVSSLSCDDLVLDDGDISLVSVEADLVAQREVGDDGEQAQMRRRAARRGEQNDHDVYGILLGARGIDLAESEMFSSLGSVRGSESAADREKDGRVDIEHVERKSGRTRRVRATDVREEQIKERGK